AYIRTMASMTSSTFVVWVPESRRTVGCSMMPQNASNQVVSLFSWKAISTCGEKTKEVFKLPPVTKTLMALRYNVGCKVSLRLFSLTELQVLVSLAVRMAQVRRCKITDSDDCPETLDKGLWQLGCFEENTAKASIQGLLLNFKNRPSQVIKEVPAWVEKERKTRKERELAMKAAEEKKKREEDTETLTVPAVVNQQAATPPPEQNDSESDRGSTRGSGDEP
ncbi:11058_t:CDS:2, partial [Acaulospora colombiana]